RHFKIDDMDARDLMPMLKYCQFAFVGEDKLGRPVIFFDYHFDGGIAKADILAIVRGFQYFIEYVDRLNPYRECVFVMDTARLKMADFDPRLEKACLRLYTEFWPMRLGPMAMVHPP
ncbi:hypothetical protein KIPB_015111, partial [Kipferlia bialata]